MRDVWKKVEIGQLGNILTGRTPPTERSEYFGQGFPFITPGDMRQGRYARITNRCLTDKGASLLSRIKVPAESICVSCIGWQMGEVIMTAKDSFTNQQINTILPGPQVYPAFLYYSLLPRKQQLLSLGAATGVRTPILNKTAFSKLTIDVPTLPMQRRIGELLTTYDELIENNQRRIRILEEMARSLYREWFVHFRYPGHENHPRVQSALGEIPQGWKVHNLGAVVDVNRAQVNARTAPQEIEYIDISSVTPGTIESVTHYLFEDAPGRARRIVQHGDVLWSCVRPNRRSHALVMYPDANTIASTGFAVLTATKLPYTYLYLATTTEDFVAYLVNSATGSAYPAVSAKTFEDADILVPSSTILEMFNAVATPVAEKTHTLQRQNHNLRQTRDLLLPRLLSGQIKLESN
jgi:type I restriction enzyme S subunit